MTRGSAKAPKAFVILISLYKCCQMLSSEWISMYIALGQTQVQGNIWERVYCAITMNRPTQRPFRELVRQLCHPPLPYTNHKSVDHEITHTYLETCAVPLACPLAYFQSKALGKATPVAQPQSHQVEGRHPLQSDRIGKGSSCNFHWHRSSSLETILEVWKSSVLRM